MLTDTVMVIPGWISISFYFATYLVLVTLAAIGGAVVYHILTHKD